MDLVHRAAAGKLPVLWSLGDYAPDKATGPAAWLRYQLETQGRGDTGDLSSRHRTLRLPQCRPMPEQAKHLFALQFQGQFWTQKNGKNWTPFAFFSSADGGLGLDVAGDQDTKRRFRRAFPSCLNRVGRAARAQAGSRRLPSHRHERPCADAFRWMGDPGKIKLELEKSGSEWTSFRAVCRRCMASIRRRMVRSPQPKNCPVARPLGLVWERYKEAPRTYPGVKELLSKTARQDDLFEKASEYKPRSNRKEEDASGKTLLALSSVLAQGCHRENPGSGR